ncbi:hypothetical protein HY643_03265 [Candidatus Woesearchaeota archaeon]|nr:hypothetical protein [Candidatus Woesearchaeota archaeon]
MIIAVIREAAVLKKKENSLVTNEDVKKVLKITDSLLSKLPKEEVAKFAKSDDSKLYEKVLDGLNIK